MSIYKGVEDTLFIPLTARIYVSKRFPEYFYDKKALELDGKINRDIENKSDEYTMLASVARYCRSDEEIKKFCHRYEKSNVIFLGVGLETAYYRLDDHLNNFYGIDLDRVIDARKEFIGFAKNETLIACDMFDMKWTEQIDTRLPSIIIVNGVFQYFKRERVVGLINELKKVFQSDTELIFDATTKKGLAFANKYVKKTGNTSALMHFYVNDACAFANNLNVEVINVFPFFKGSIDIIKERLTLKTKLYMCFADRGGRAKVIHLKIN